MDRTVNPDVQASIEDARALIKATSTRSRRVKVDKNEIWTVRFLPVEMGAKRRMWGNIAYHWIGKRPYYCPRHTPPDMGGDKNALCELCEYIDPLAQDNTAAFRCTAQVAFHLFCITFTIRRASGVVEQIRGDDRWEAWECTLNRHAFPKLLNIYEKGTRRCDLSIFDLNEGRDIDIEADNRNVLSFTADDPKPIVNATKRGTNEWDEAYFNSIIEKIWATIKLPDVKTPSADEWATAIERVDEFLASQTKSSRRGRGDREIDSPAERRGSGRGEVSDDNYDMGNGQYEDDRGGKAQPRDDDRRAPTPPRQAPPPPTRTAPPPPARAAAAPPPPARAAAAPPPPRSAPPPPPRTPPPPARRAPAAAPPTGTDIEETDNVTDEQRDPAPPAEAAPDPQAAEAPANDPVNEAPPPVQATGARLGDRLTRSIAQAKSRM